MSTEIAALRIMVRGAYDLQMVRMQVGLRLCANFRSKLKTPEESDVVDESGELSEEAKKIITQLRDSYRTLTEGVARNRTIPTERGFKGDALISTYAELVLVDQYMSLETQESRQFRQLQSTLDKIPIYQEYIRNQIGIGPAMAAVLITYLDPAKANYISSFWKYSGLDVGPDGRGRSRREEHLVQREYINKAGNAATRMGITYNPFLKTKLMGVLAGSFLRSGSNWRHIYDNYRNRLETDPARIKINVTDWKKRYGAGEDVTNLWTPGRIHQAALRYMVKMFLADLWLKWRALEGLPLTPSYHEAKLGHIHGGGQAA